MSFASVHRYTDVADGTGGGAGIGVSNEIMNIEASSDVFVNSLGAHRLGDAWDNGAVMATGSATVFVNGRPLARVGDLVSGGSVAATGSTNVYSG